jgi:hypothetical protein
MRYTNLSIAMTVMVGLLATTPAAQQDIDSGGDLRCKRVHGDLVEVQSTTECRPGHAVCFLGEVDGNHGLRGTTYFRGEQGAAFPPSAPTFRSYVGSFDYMTPSGSLMMREMGLTEPFIATNPETGVVNAFQRVIAGTGEFEGATGYLFVSGFNRNQRVVTTFHGVICKARREQ